MREFLSVLKDILIGMIIALATEVVKALASRWDD